MDRAIAHVRAADRIAVGPLDGVDRLARALLRPV
jgi:hypothetical protein